MKTTRTPTQAEQQLAHVADRFDHWRQTRTSPAEPIPPSLFRMVSWYAYVGARSMRNASISR